jgi:hypothetical protein
MTQKARHESCRAPRFLQADFGPELVTVPSRLWYPCTAMTIGDDSPNVSLGVGTHPRGNPVHSLNRVISSVRFGGIAERTPARHCRLSGSRQKECALDL